MENNAYLRVMSFNVLLDWRKEGPYVWPNRRDSVASMIRFHHADIAGLQEPLKNQVEDLSSLLPEYAWVGIGREDGKEKGEYAAIFYRKERFEALDHGTFWLSETPDVPGSMGWDAACVRCVTWAKFKDKQTGKEHFHFNTHFDHVGMTAQAQSAHLLLDRIKAIAKGMPVVVTGDFNCDETFEAYKILTGAGSDAGASKHECLTDAMQVSEHGNHGSRVTFHGLEDEVNKARIDMIFVKNGIKVLQHGVLDDKPKGSYPSDHSPVVADIVVC
ncbi:endonuclease/exonuclease/phosphatase family protein [Clostridium thermosuccinogenes]|nr:endonuclease/exonuclease/phosphatase family protein [Pseudoclostridium thermosuccinogenes]